MTGKPNAQELLEQLFDAERRARELEAALLASARGDELERSIGKAVEHAFELSDSTEQNARLTRLADLCAQVQGSKMADALIQILNHEDPQVRVAAGEALRDFAYDRYAEVARAIERAFERDLAGPALSEIPWILAEIAEPSAIPLIGRCLKHRDPEVVASGIEALAELGDPEVVPLLKALTQDKRVVELDEGENAFSTTLGELASEAIAELDAQ